MSYLANLGHREIAIIKGQDFSSDTEIVCKPSNRPRSCTTSR